MAFNFSVSGEEYEKILGASHKYYIKIKCEELLKLLKEIDYYPSTILDLGCGTGEAEEILYRFFNKIIGIDLSESMLRKAKIKRVPNCKFERANMLKLPYKDNFFDLVFSFCTFHHLPKNKRNLALKEAVRVTKNNGIVTIFEHNPRNPITQHIVKKSPIDKGVILISLDEIRNLFESYGLTILKEKFLIFFPKFLSPLRLTEELLSKLPYGGQYMIAGRKG